MYKVYTYKISPNRKDLWKYFTWAVQNTTPPAVFLPRDKNRTVDNIIIPIATTVSKHEKRGRVENVEHCHIGA